LYFSSLAGTPHWDTQLHPFGTQIDARTWAAYFDMLDFDSAGADKGGKWELQDFVVGSILAPVASPDAPQSARFTISDLTSGNTFSSEGTDGSGLVSVAENVPSAGKITFVDGGRTPAGGGTYALWQQTGPNAGGHGTVQWEANKLVRATVYLSCPTTADRDNFHKFRVRHYIGYLNMISTFIITATPILAPEATFLNPGAPESEEVAPGVQTPYEVYLSPLGGPAGALLTNPSFDAYRRWSLALDELAADPGTDGANAREMNPTNVVVHKVLYEMLDEPAGIP